LRLTPRPDGGEALFENPLEKNQIEVDALPFRFRRRSGALRYGLPLQLAEPLGFP
jgi:hypothetical protein